MPELRRLLRAGYRHMQVDATTGSGKSREVPSVVSEEMFWESNRFSDSRLLVLTTSTVDVTGMHKDTWCASCYRMGGGIEGGEPFDRSHGQFPQWGRSWLYCFNCRWQRFIAERTYGRYIHYPNARSLYSGFVKAARICSEFIVINVSIDGREVNLSYQSLLTHDTGHWITYGFKHAGHIMPD